MRLAAFWIMKKLLIIESPNKKKKIAEVLGSDWIVAASIGHVRDLIKSGLGVDRLQDYLPKYEVDEKKKSVVLQLRDLVGKVGAENVFLATDPDREGESISKHLSILLKLDPRAWNRVEFHELSPKAIKQAIQNPRQINMRMVQAQEGRRVIDRLVGWEVSDILNRKLGANRLSAGRVQSVALRLVVERERTIEGFADHFEFKVKGEFGTDFNEIVKATLKGSFQTDAEARAYLQSVGSKHFTVSNIETRPVEVRPPAPFITSSLQQEAIRKFKWTAKRVMEVAQSLFSQGLITYMRTDSPNLSDDAITDIRKYLAATHGESHFQVNRFKAKESAQEAHEAIRPTHIEEMKAGVTDEEKMLYSLIWHRAIASQMKPARYQQTIVSIGASPGGEIYEAKTRVMEYPGFKLIYEEESGEDAEEGGETLKRPLHRGDALRALMIEARQTYQTPPKRYDEASLVKDLEAKGIGRPSTYASILSNISDRHYIEVATRPGRKVGGKVYTYRMGKLSQSDTEQTLGNDKNKLVPTDNGTRIIRFLEKHFQGLVDYGFTAEMEQALDEIMEGKRNYGQVVRDFDNKHSTMLRTTDGSVEDVPVERKTRALGEFEKAPISVGVGDYGTYVVWNGKFFKLGEVKPEEVTFDGAVQAILLKRAKEAEYQAGILHQLGKYVFRKGEFGIFMVYGDKRVPCRNYTEESIKSITAEQCKALVASYEQYLKTKNSGGSSSAKKAGGYSGKSGGGAKSGKKKF